MTIFDGESAIRHIHAVAEIGMNGGYATIDEALTPDEAHAVETVLVVGVQMKDSRGLVCPLRIPPAAALAIVRALKSS